MSDWIAWVIWIVVVLGSFAYLEWRGWRRHGVKGTLSSLVWYVLFKDWERRFVVDGGLPRRPRWLVWPLVTWPFLWLFLHFGFGVPV